MVAILLTLLVIFASYGETEETSTVECDTFVSDAVTQCVDGETGETVDAWFTGRPVNSGRVAIERDSTGIEVIYYPPEQ